MLEWLAWSVPWVCLIPATAVAMVVGYRWGWGDGLTSHDEDCWIAHRPQSDWREREGWTH